MSYNIYFQGSWHKASSWYRSIVILADITVLSNSDMDVLRLLEIKCDPLPCFLAVGPSLACVWLIWRNGRMVCATQSRLFTLLLPQEDRFFPPPTFRPLSKERCFVYKIRPIRRLFIRQTLNTELCRVFRLIHPLQPEMKEAGSSGRCADTAVKSSHRAVKR